jgi:hypothetical protein
VLGPWVGLAAGGSGVGEARTAVAGSADGDGSATVAVGATVGLGARGVAVGTTAVLASPTAVLVGGAVVSLALSATSVASWTTIAVARSADDGVGAAGGPQPMRTLATTKRIETTRTEPPPRATNQRG